MPFAFTFDVIDVSELSHRGKWSHVFRHTDSTSWKLNVCKVRTGKEEFLGVYLKSMLEVGTQWKVRVRAIFSITDTQGKKKEQIEDLVFTPDQRTLGIPCLLKWKKIVDGTFAADDTVRAHVVVRVEEIKGICPSPHYIFTTRSTDSDVVVSIEGRNLYLHKQFLSLNSPVFKQLFSQPLPPTRIYDIDNVKFDEFVNLLHIIYPGTGREINRNNCASLLLLADRFQIKHVIDQAEAFALREIIKRRKGKQSDDDLLRSFRLEHGFMGEIQTMDDMRRVSQTAAFLALDMATQNAIFHRSMTLP